ncbi:alpha/beta fold hydrolase [Trujillonella humicola]|uniref:alpha/beta fold hydrolase n=1 Tax=Trujillonella humicola TaxID=3383699 RepID=UPI003906B723
MTTTAIDGVDLEYSVTGAGPPLLLIHGNGGGAVAWHDTVEDLARDWRVIAYDRRGFGGSVHPPIRDWHRHARDAAALLERLDAAPATVLGWSGGGIVALDLAVTSPAHVAALVLAEPPLHAKRHMTVRMAWTMLGAQVLRRTTGEEAAAVRFYRWASRRTTGGCAFDDFAPALRAAMRSTAAATLAELDAGTGEHLTGASIGTIRCPVTCLLGAASDPALTAATRRLVRMLPQATVVPIAGAGHALHVDRPREYADAVRSAMPAPDSEDVGAPRSGRS